jgi:tetratricopeptide (TPR) repeat protein/tRNA A-37 threonylcarbamoyl transferase component Bud32
MKCPRCGIDVSTSASRCPGCSSPLGDSPATLVRPLHPSDAASTLANGLPFGNSDATLAGEAPFPDDAATLAGSAPAAFDAATVASKAPLAGEALTVAAPARPPVEGGDSGPLRTGQNFGARYHIIKALGIGGMGAVYQAWDAELGEAVAIKVIRPEVMADRIAAAELEKRFKRELLLARQVTHKNVVRIHDLGEIEGIKYITMTYVEGTDLSTLLKEEGTLGVERSLEITRSIIEGLLAAHSAGVVHRDLKPANIMIRDDGEALIMDFGIARSTGAPAEIKSLSAALPADLRHTASTRYTEATTIGSVVGTVQYMAPEQARGHDIDQRADIYALGLIMYDMMAGRQRLTRFVNPVEELKDRMARAPIPIQSLVPAVPAALDQIVSRCIEPDVTKRFPSTEALAAALGKLDAHGEPIPIKRVVGVRMTAAIVTLVAALGGVAVYYSRQALPPAPKDPVSVVIADLQNNTGDPAFDRTLEPMIKRALEGAGFITAYDRNGIRGLGTTARDRLDEKAANELAVANGLGVVLSGAIDPQGSGYRISMKAQQAVTGTQIADEQARASGKDQVLEVATGLVGEIRNALGDDNSDSAQQFAMASLSATSLDVVRLYARALEAQSSNRYAEAQQDALKAVELDPKFGIGYLILATTSRALGRLEDNQKYLSQALSHLDGMTERERFQTRGYSYLTAGDYEQCVKEFSDLIAKYPADVAGRNQLALCLSNRREMRRAMDEVNEIVKILPNHPLFRDNLALYANYASDFQTAEEEARKVGDKDVYAVLSLALAQLGQGQVQEAAGTYRKLMELGPQGTSMGTSGLGDIAAYQGRFSEAVQILQKGAADDVAAKNPDAAAAKLIAAAHAELSRGRARQAVERADAALAQSKAVKIRFLTARTYIEADSVTKAQPIVEDLAKELYAEPRAYAKQLEGLIALKNGDARQAITLLREANGLFDTWIGQFDLGRASLAANAFTQADSAFDLCINGRRGEALALFVDEEPTAAYLPQAYYYQGLVREGLKTAGAAESFRQFLAIRNASTEDPLVAEARKRVTS